MHSPMTSEAAADTFGEETAGRLGFGWEGLWGHGNGGEWAGWEAGQRHETAPSTLLSGLRFWAGDIAIISSTRCLQPNFNPNVHELSWQEDRMLEKWRGQYKDKETRLFAFPQPEPFGLPAPHTSSITRPISGTWRARLRHGKRLKV